MPNPYLYVVVALVVVLVVVGAYLGMMVSSEMAKVTALQGQFNALKTNYTTLESQYTQLQSQYNQLQTQYNELETNYTALQSQYGQLKTNYTSVTSTISFYTSMIKPVAYVYEGSIKNNFGLYLNMTNPTNRPMNITIEVAVTGFEIIPPTLVLIPPHTTILYPIMLMLFNSTFNAYVGPGISGGLPAEASTVNGMLEQLHPIITLFTSNLTNLGIPGFAYNTSAIKTIVKIKVNTLLGVATYSTEASWFYLNLENPLSSAVAINGYAVYSYNGTLLISCTMSPAITVNATTIISGMIIPTYTETSYSTYISVITPTSELPTEEVSFSTTCTVNYQFPASVAQLPYGYVVLNTSVGNMTILLIPNP